MEAAVELEKVPEELAGWHFVPSGQQFHIKQKSPGIHLLIYFGQQLWSLNIYWTQRFIEKMPSSFPQGINLKCLDNSNIK